MASTLAALLAFLLGLQSSGLTYIPRDDTGAPVNTGPITFTVESAAPVDEYAGLVPATGNMLLQVAITTQNNTNEAFTLYDSHYPIHWGGTFLDWDYCFTALTEEMAPLEYTLPPGESATFTYLYEIPATAVNPAIVHIRYGQDAHGEESITAFYPSYLPFGALTLASFFPSTAGGYE